MPSSIASNPSNGSNVTGYGSLAFSVQDGLKSVYLGETPCQFKNEALVTETAYTLHEASSKTANIAAIIAAGRLAVLKIQNGKLQSLVINPNLQLIANVSKFILFINDEKGQKNSIVLPDQLTVKKLNDDQYKKLAAKLYTL